VYLVVTIVVIEHHSGYIMVADPPMKTRFIRVHNGENRWIDQALLTLLEQLVLNHMQSHPSRGTIKKEVTYHQFPSPCGYHWFIIHLSNPDLRMDLRNLR